MRLPSGIRSRQVAGVNGLSMHVLEAGDPRAPVLMLLHGFPELAFSWRKLMVPLAALGYHVVAPDQRGFGQTTGQDCGYDVDLAPFRMTGLATDMVALLHALGHARAAAVIGHDFGSLVAGWCALARPDLFGAVAMMSAPFTGPAPLPRTMRGSGPPAPDIHAALAALPRPRKHYAAHYSTRGANAEMMACPQGLGAFLAAYCHVKSGDWPGNAPHPLAGWTAEALAEMPTYYIMDLAQGMAETVAPFMPEQLPDWLTAQELAVYTEEFGRTGFQGGLNWYRARHEAQVHGERLFAGRRIEVPAVFIAGARDWGIHQAPGGLEAMARLCRSFAGVRLIDGAGHWVQQERPEAVLAELTGFLGQIG
ncbi:alpha/beta hydrolase [Sandarakinorhabdus oryzae]|uniref:alpha/beta hydrolase n=1 Tax=Sandarakinorhabdus oryzae TaxID=2675220 RepID=UPI0018CC2123|nr:alpha/beta hydrolase [Sandarakinorhabdus oryzae]